MSEAQLTIDLKKVSYAKFYWRNQLGIESRTKPTKPTVNGITFNPRGIAIPLIHEYPSETMMERAKRMNWLDVWTPHIELQFSNTHRLFFRGKKAMSYQQAYRARVFNSTKKKDKSNED